MNKDIPNVTIHNDQEGTYTSVEVHVEMEFRTGSITIKGWGKDREMAAKNVVDELVRFKGASERKSLHGITLIKDNEDIPDIKDYIKESFKRC